MEPLWVVAKLGALVVLLWVTARVGHIVWLGWRSTPKTVPWRWLAVVAVFWVLTPYLFVQESAYRPRTAPAESMLRVPTEDPPAMRAAPTRDLSFKDEFQRNRAENEAAREAFRNLNPRD